MKYATRILALTLTLLPLLAAAQMKSSERLVTQVPFDFRVADKLIPGGELVVQPITMDGRTLMIRNDRAKVSLLSTAAFGENKAAADRYALVFNKYGEKRFLAGIKVEGSRTIYRFALTAAEAEMRAQNLPITQEVLLASLQ